MARHRRCPSPAAPPAAERARTVLAVAPTVTVSAHGSDWTVARHGTDPEGRPLLLVTATPAEALTCTPTGAVRQPVRVALHAAQLHLLRAPDRVRHRVEIRGTVTAVPTAEADRLLAADRRFLDALDECALLRVEPAGILLDGATVGLAEYRTAAADPFASVEDSLLREMLATRQEDLVWLCTLLGAEALTGATEIAPIGLDRWGLTMRIAGTAGVGHHRIAFPDPVDRVEALRRTLRRLIAFARSATCDEAWLSTFG
ncbi:DUF2470 domain-containing protein [Pseudonocardia sp.]|uniref:DUF2470 domain-containing protein n=1 Tax=Pseudonocardia sp. TaxID=60912 RepID=UPI003D0C0BF7